MDRLLTKEELIAAVHGAFDRDISQPESIAKDQDARTDTISRREERELIGIELRKSLVENFVIDKNWDITISRKALLEIIQALERGERPEVK